MRLFLRAFGFSSSQSFASLMDISVSINYIMETLLNVVLEIIKITIPALIVFLTVYYILKTYLDKQYQLKVLEGRQKNKKTTLPMRLQAYERLSLFCERISIPSLLLRLQEEEQTAAQLRLKLLISIQQEFEYNITQQVYISEQLWQIVKIAREDTMTIISTIAEKTAPGAPSSTLATALLSFVETQPESSLEKALSAIKKEAALLL